MILFCHLIVGAALMAKIQIIPLALFLAFLSHYFLDSLPHWEYSVDNILEKQWKKAKLDFLKGALDFGFGILIIFAISKNQPIILAGAFLAVLPDGLTLLSLLLPNKLLKIHDNFHRELVHYSKKISFKENKTLFFLGILTQILVSIAALFFLIF